MQFYHIINIILDRMIEISCWVKLHIQIERGGNYEDN